MPQSDDSASHDLLASLADDFISRCQRGESPSLETYAAEYPQLADRIRRLFPTMQLMEQHQPAPSDLGPALEGRLGDFTILREIGRGGMGIVYEAEQSSLGRRVALKLLPPHVMLSDSHVGRFEREARAAARLHHTNIVPVFGVGEHKGLHYYAMQFIGGVGLDVVLEQLRRFASEGSGNIARASASDTLPTSDAEVTESSSEPSVVRIAYALFRSDLSNDRSGAASGLGTSSDSEPDSVKLALSDKQSAAGKFRSGVYWSNVAIVGIQVADALNYAHEQGVLHRDIKPANILLDTNGTAWVTDFGLAKDSQSVDLTETGDVIGTLRYMAPEQLSGVADARSDVYALGITLYELLTLRPAYDDADRERLMGKLARGEPPRPRRIADDVPRDLETIVLKAIARDPHRRYATAGDLRDDLTCFTEGRPIQARRVSLAERAIKWIRRRPAIATLLLALVVVATLGVGGIAWQWHEKRLAEVEVVEKGKQQAQAAAAAESAKQLLATAESERRRADLMRRRAEEADALNRRLVYLADVRLANTVWSRDDAAQAIRILQRYASSDVRNIEWHFLQRKCRPDLLTIDPDIRDAQLSRFTKDGKHIILASRSTENGIMVFDAANGTKAKEFTNSKGIQFIDVNPDGELLAERYRTKIQVREIESGKILYERPAAAANSVHNPLAFNAEGRRLAWPVREGIHLVDSRTGTQGRQLNIPDLKEIHGFDYSERFLVVGDHGGRLLAFNSMGTLQQTLKTPARVGSALSGANDRYLAATSMLFLEITELRSGRKVISERFSKRNSREQGPASAAFLGRTHFAASDGAIVRIWNLKSKKELPPLRGHVTNVVSVDFHAASQRVLTTSRDGVTKVWDFATHAPSDRATNSHGIALDCTSHGRLMGMAEMRAKNSRLVSNGVLALQDSTSGRVLRRLQHEAPLKGARFSPDDSKLLAADVEGQVYLWDVATGSLIKSLQVPSPAQCLTWDRGGQLVAWGCPPQAGKKPSVITVWDLEGEPRPLASTSPQAPRSLALRVDDNRLAAVTFNDQIQVWDLSSGQMTHTAPLQIRALDLSHSLPMALRSLWEAIAWRSSPRKPGSRGAFCALSFSATR